MKIKLIEDQNSRSIFLFFRSLKFLLENYQSSYFMDAIIWPVLIENVRIYLVSLTYPWPTYDCLFLYDWQSVFISLLSVGFQKTWNGFPLLSWRRGKRMFVQRKETLIRLEGLSVFYYRSWKANITMQDNKWKSEKTLDTLFGNSVIILLFILTTLIT